MKYLIHASDEVALLSAVMHIKLRFAEDDGGRRRY
jgi:hypothetical protein